MQSATITPEEALLIRQSLRQQGIAARRALPAAEHSALSARIEAHLEAELAAHPNGTIAFCWPFQAEFDVRPLALRLLAAGRTLCLPVVQEAGQPLRFRQWHESTLMQPDRYGIATPQDGAWLTPEIILLPFNAVDAAGYRLGYGAGYFDRTLAAMSPRPYVIGVGFSLGVVPSVHPQIHDIPLNCVITEDGLLKPA